MDHLLVIEASTKMLSLALFQNGKLLSETVKEPDEKTHSEQILVILDDLISKNSISLEKINKIAVSIGPGSYTSLRVGLATVFGFCEGKNYEVIPYSSLEAMAFGFDRDGVIIPLLKAGRGRMYAGIFEKKEGQLTRLKTDSSLLPSDLDTFIKNAVSLSHDRTIALIGPGLALFSDRKPDFAYDENFNPRASYAGKMVLSLQKPVVSAEKIVLQYLQEPDFG